MGAKRGFLEPEVRQSQDLSDWFGTFGPRHIWSRAPRPPPLPPPLHGLWSRIVGVLGFWV